ncbi:MAG TPA: galactosamine-6-phosphate isomerase [Saprospiraceae bacterium]|nr:galactosamine-6-phosphate isomerase [Saprospiraceae bacterium]HMQ83871.1 galactosamine-6-phosphate isomerase [Saprospiraceae bacterium]
MQIHYCTDYEQMSRQVAELLLAQIKATPDLLLCAATGYSPMGAYQHVVKSAADDPDLFAALRLVKLDEWGDLPENAPESCEFYLQEHLIQPLHISADRYFAFQNQPADPVAECQRLQSALEAVGPLDIAVLGLGQNGHLGLNEPGDFLQPHCHVAQLAETTLHHGMIQSAATRPSYGLTLGIGNLLQSRMILLLVTGANKEKALEALLAQRISTQWPVSLLWGHPNVVCWVDEKSVGS